MSYLVTTIKGLVPSRRRGIAFLECTTDERVNAKTVFDWINDKTKRDVLGRFDLWLAGGKCDKYFHGWPNDRARKECFVFKWKRAGSHHRMYGFLFHPKPDTDAAFQVCILVSHAQKNTEHTDPSELEFANDLRTRHEVIEAIKRVFPES
jgi:hypothetical protein